MELGRTIKYYRMKRNMTQAELAEGVCSIPHLSKIENNIYQANHGTATLLLKRLGVDIEDEYAQYTEIKRELEQFIEAIQFVDVTEANRLMDVLSNKEYIIARTNLINTFHLYMMRYHLMHGHTTLASEQRIILDQNRTNLTAIEELSYKLFNGILLVGRNRFRAATNILLELQNEDYSSKYLFVREVAFFLSQCYTQMDEPEKATVYAKEALYIFKQEDNYIRAFHTQMLLGINYTQMNMVEESTRLYKVLLRNTRLFGHENLYHQALYNYGILLKKMGTYEQSQQCFSDCLTFFEKESQNYVVCLLASAEVLFHMQAEKERIQLLINEIYQISTSRGLKRLGLQAKYLHLRLKSGDEMYGFIEEELLPHLEKADNQSEPLPYALELADWYQSNGDYEKANEYLKKYVLISKKGSDRCCNRAPLKLQPEHSESR
ncbi:helix-turn-helix transcriptional regulator [Shouchella shacheensis]|uniref:helix-turn-helix transcriptional regulator n=1 Tax=Shouchella shacheensis TaxID=1649580 RepID=UPI00073FCC9A|nr:helix-turn-helix transcriptional regulator [Shouchella shacheensis]